MLIMKNFFKWRNIDFYITSDQNLIFLMILSNFESISYSFGGKHPYSTKNIYGDITSKGSKVIIGYRSICYRKKSMTANDKTIKAEGLCDFLQNLV